MMTDDDLDSHNVDQVERSRPIRGKLLESTMEEALSFDTTPVLLPSLFMSHLIDWWPGSSHTVLISCFLSIQTSFLTNSCLYQAQPLPRNNLMAFQRKQDSRTGLVAAVAS